MGKINENIIHLYNKWKKGYTRKENSFKLRVQIFLSNKTDVNRYKISEDGKCLNASGNVYILDEDILDGKFIVPFGEVKGAFDCSDCASLTSLEGAPKEVEGAFECYDCSSLTSLKGAPEKVGDNFDCGSCINLTSIEDLSKEIGMDLYIDKRFKGKIPDDVTIGGKIKYV